MPNISGGGGITVVRDADVAADAQIAVSKLDNGADGQILITDATTHLPTWSNAAAVTPHAATHSPGQSDALQFLSGSFPLFGSGATIPPAASATAPLFWVQTNLAGGTLYFRKDSTTWIPAAAGVTAGGSASTVNATVLSAITTRATPASETAVSVVWKAKLSNTAIVYIGEADSTITNAGAGSVITDLNPGDSMTLDITNPNKIQYVAASGTQTVYQTVLS